MMQYLAHVADLALNQPLAILPKKAAAIAAVLGPRIGLDDAGVQSLIRSAPGPAANTQRSASRGSSGYAKIGRGIALISAVGTLVPRASFLEAESGLKSYDKIKDQALEADSDPDVTSILIDINSPGGAVAGCFECADIIQQVSRRRPVIAVGNTMMCSAAYALAAAANKIVVAPSSIVGSIGVICLHVDYSRQLERRGVTPTFVFAGKRKADGNAFEPLNDAVKADIQLEVDACMDLFVASVAKHRPKLTEKKLRDTEARTYLGADAVRLGLADEVGTIEQVIVQLAKLHPVVTETKYDKIERMYGRGQASHERLQDAHAAGVRAGLAAALAGRK